MVNHQLMTPLLEFPSNATELAITMIPELNVSVLEFPSNTTESAITMIPELNVSVLYSRYHTMAHFYITV